MTTKARRLTTKHSQHAEWHHRDRPSEYYLGAILRGFDKAQEQHGQVTSSEIWDNVVMECLHSRDGFRAMFAWDNRKSVNRVGDILEVIEAGFVPGLRIERTNGKPVVVET